MDTAALAQQFGYRIVAHRNKLAGKADDMMQALHALHLTTTGVDERRGELRQAATGAMSEWEGAGSERFEFRNRRINRRMRQTGDASEHAERAVADATAAVSGGHTAAQRMVDEYTAKAKRVLDAGLAVSGTGASAALMQAVATVSDQLVPHYTRESAGNLRRAHEELSEAAKRLNALTRELRTDGFADPGSHERKRRERNGDKPRPTRSAKTREILRAARKETGYHETGNNINKFGPAGQPWCAYFATDMWRKAGVNIPNYGFTGDVYRWGQEHGKAYGAGSLKQARPGDVLLFGTGPSRGAPVITAKERADGIVVEVSPGGALHGLTLDDRAMRLGRAELAARVLALVERATAAANATALHTLAAELDGLDDDLLVSLGVGQSAEVTEAAELTTPEIWRV